jgi:ketosteroid isomerase-like protein
MSHENVEIAKRAVDAFSRRDLAAYYDELFTPDYEWFPALVGAVDGDSFRGREGIEAYVETASEAWETDCKRARSVRCAALLSPAPPLSHS